MPLCWLLVTASFVQNPTSSHRSIALRYDLGEGTNHRGTKYAVHRVKSPQDFVDFLAKDDRLVVVKIGAKWCRVCRAFDIRWYKLVNQLADKLVGGHVVERGLVRFAEIEFTENEDLCRGLQATKLPHVLMFKGAMGSAGLLDHFQCGPAAFDRVIETVDKYLKQAVGHELDEFNNLP
jgi:thioredoxin-like negative regulator of GroEL